MDLRPLAPIAGGILGNMILPGIGGMALGSGLARFADGTAHHESLGDAAKAGAITGGATYAGGKAFGALKGMFSPSSTTAVTNAGDTLMSNGRGSGGPSFLSRVGDFAEKHPTAISAGLQGLGNIASSGAQNDFNSAQARRLNTENDAAEYELGQRKSRDAALEPLRQMLAGQMSSMRANKYGIAPNPYV